MAGWSTLTAFVLDQIFGYQTANVLKERDAALASARPYFVGGSRNVGVAGISSPTEVNVYDYVDFELDGDQVAGLTVRLRCEVRTSDAATSVIPRVRNVTDDVVAAEGVASAATDLDYGGASQKQTLSWTPPSGVKTFRAALVMSGAVNDVYGIAHLEVIGSDP